MKKISHLFMTLGCLCILVSCCLFGYEKYRQNKEIKDMKRLYDQSVQLIPDSYIPSDDGYLDVQGHDIQAVLKVGDIKWVIGKEDDLPHYKNKNIVIPDLYLNQLQSLKSKDILTIQSISGYKTQYELEVIGEVDTLSSDTLYMYCKSGLRYYCINLIMI